MAGDGTHEEKDEKKKSFSQRIIRIIEWCKRNDTPDTLSKPIKKLKSKDLRLLSGL